MPAIIDKVAKRSHLISAAASTFARKGFHATKMQDVAVCAGVSKGALYEYFATKEDLFLAVYDAWMSEYEETARRKFEEAEDAIGRADAVRHAAVEFYLQRAEQAPLLLEFWAHALRSGNAAFLARARRTTAVLTEMGESIACELIEAGAFAPIEPRSLTLLEAGISDGIFLLWALSGRTFPLDAAYIFRQSLLGMGLLSDDGRTIIRDYLREKLEDGFLPKQNGGDNGKAQN
ncbi:MAG: TetR/AcrR family transcriptional regulator [Bacteroidetes bacterium]|jgi:AcrR family transcriptional regulator|nr:TetR/AcrR family transcriptional regulator [Bacteroidota bacterium]MCZ2131931.1 TetR/AcrR family transcriptional regulator [Bacteroidota bacterium]